jgi:hypothetical protein
MLALLFVLPSAAHAGAYLSATLGTGPDGYRSTEVRGNADLFDTPLNVNALVFKSDSSSGDPSTQSALGIDWSVSELVTLGASHSKQDNSQVEITGNSISLGLMLDTLWEGDLQTRLDLKHSASAYQFKGLPPSVKNDTLNQTTNSLGLSQDLADPVTIYAYHDQYSYDRDPKQAAQYLMRTAPRRSSNTRTSLLSFPDSSNSFGITWRALDDLTLDISTSKTTTQLDQEQKSRHLGIDYQVTDKLNLTASVTFASSTEVVTKQAIFPSISSLTIPAGTVVLSATNDRYAELGLGWSF